MTKIRIRHMHRVNKKLRKKYIFPKNCMVCNSIFRVKKDALIIYCLRRYPARNEPNHLDTCSILCMNMATLVLLGE